MSVARFWLFNNIDLQMITMTTINFSRSIQTRPLLDLPTFARTDISCTEKEERKVRGLGRVLYKVGAHVKEFVSICKFLKIPMPPMDLKYDNQRKLAEVTGYMLENSGPKVSNVYGLAGESSVAIGDGVSEAANLQ
ncbi:hypothetical protein LguiA_023024 [Lonicera macranthoides]